MADISGISFGQTIDLLGNAIKGADLENDQIANNIANINTPNYRRSTTSFKDALQASLGTPPASGDLAMTTDSTRQFALGATQAPVPFDPQPHVDESDRMRVDGSNVDIDQEMGMLSDNSGYQQDMNNLLMQQYKRMREAIQEQPA